MLDMSIELTDCANTRCGRGSRYRFLLTLSTLYVNTIWRRAEAKYVGTTLVVTEAISHIDAK